MDTRTLKLQAHSLLIEARNCESGTNAANLRDRARNVFAQAEHLERTGHFIELPLHFVG